MVAGGQDILEVAPPGEGVPPVPPGKVARGQGEHCPFITVKVVDELLPPPSVAGRIVGGKQ